MRDSEPSYLQFLDLQQLQLCFLLYERHVSVSVVRINAEQLTMHFGAFKIEPRVIFRCSVLDLNDVCSFRKRKKILLKGSNCFRIFLNMLAGALLLDGLQDGYMFDVPTKQNFITEFKSCDKF